jgi:23S rRNA pseudouridine1911/1915/1917 synthase
LLGDPVYGGDATKLQAQHPALFCGQCLHAKELRLIHPRTGQRMEFFCELPKEFQELLELLERKG